MDKKDFYGPFVIVALSIAFAAVSLAVFLSKGKSPKWIARKMKIGALLLTFTSAACNNGGQVSCYDTVAPNTIWLEAQGQKGIELNIDSSSVLTGSISSVQGKDFSFALVNNQNKKVQTGQLIPTDGNFDAFDEKFKLEIDKNTFTGLYLLKIYSATVAAQDTTYPKFQVNLNVKSGN